MGSKTWLHAQKACRQLHEKYENPANWAITISEIKVLMESTEREREREIERETCLSSSEGQAGAREMAPGLAWPSQGFCSSSLVPAHGRAPAGDRPPGRQG